MAKTKEEAIKHMLLALPHFRHSVAVAKEQGDLRLGIIALKPDGSGKVICQFKADEFFDDLATIIDAPPQTKEDTLEAQAKMLLDTLGIGRK